MTKHTFIFISIIYILSIGISLNSCHKNEQTEQNENRIDYSQCTRKHWKEIPDSLLGKAEYIVLDTTNVDCDFGEISKILIKQGRIYILDSHLRKLVVYDISGEGLWQIGQWGQGPKEYLDVSDFDVSSDGHIYFIDGRLDKLYCFDNNGEFEYSKPLPFEADIIAATDNGFLFGLSSWNKKKGKNYKIAITDHELNIKDCILPYDEYQDPTYWISTYTFVRTKDFIAYNQPINNHIYLFDYSGILKGCINFDFGEQNVPNEVKKDIERHLPSFDKYCMLKKFVAVTDRTIAGVLWQNKKTVPFVFDRVHNICYYNDPISDYDNSAMTGYTDSKWITYLEPGTGNKKELPDSISLSLGKNYFVLVTQELY